MRYPPGIWSHAEVESEQRPSMGDTADVVHPTNKERTYEKDPDE